MNYFVAALPRSRTAWLSMFLSQSGHFCFHDGFNGCRSIAEYKAKIAGCGDASTGLQQFNINKMYPDAPIVVIEKNEQEYNDCIAWANQTYGIKYSDEMKRQHDLLAKVDGIRVQQSTLDKNLRLIFEHLTGKEWNPVFQEMVELNIQVANPHNLDVKAAKALALDYANLNNL